MDSVVHFEMPYDEPERLQQFYRSTFGWEMNTLGEQMGNYVLATTTESSDAGPVKPGAINGGFFARSSEMPDQYPSVVIAVTDIRASMEKVTAAGGKVLGDPMEIPGIGQYVSFHDTEGNRVGMLQPLPMK
jgi:predicted enzyme related to lactoylglutathione lyase